MKTKVLVAVLALLAIGGFGWYSFAPKAKKSSLEDLEFSEEEQESCNCPDQIVTQEKIVFDIAGAVVSPGVYELPLGAMVADGVQIAGGFMDTADLTYVSRNVNMSNEITNHSKIYIPFIGENLYPVVSNDAGTDTKININVASLADLDTLPGVGPAIAQKIIDGRPYETIDEIKEVSGIGDKLFEKIKGKICI